MSCSCTHEKHCDYCLENGTFCDKCGRLFVDDCMNDLCFDCRLAMRFEKYMMED